MLVVCDREGLTLGQSVFRKGHVFKLPDAEEKRIAKLSPDQLMAEQRKIYGNIIFHKATVDDIITAYRAKLITAADMDNSEKQVLVQRVKSLAERKIKAADTLMEDDEDPSVIANKGSENKVAEDSNPLDLL